VFFRQEYPDTSTGSTGRFQVKSENYGIQGFFRPVRSRSFLSWKAARRDTYGAGFDAIVDSNNDNAGLNVTVPYGEAQSVRMQLNWNRTQSRNGSPGLPIFESSSTSRTSRLNAENKFGADLQVVLDQSLTRLQQTVSGTDGTELDRWDYNGTLRWKQTDRLNSTGTYRFYDTDRNEERNRGNAFVATTNFRVAPRFATSARGRFSKSDGNGFSQKNMGATFTANYRRDVSVGELVVNGAITIGRRDQQTSRDSASVFDEPARLNGVVPTPLQEEFAIVETTIVTNADRTQTFIEGIDYRLVTIGASTTIERLIDGNILDGQLVLVSYEFLTGGTVKYGSVSQSVSSALNMPRFVNVFFSFAKVDNETLSGVATTPLNDMTQYEIGISKSHAFSSGWSLSGEARVLNIDEDISPSARSTFALSLGLPALKSTRVRLTARREMVDYSASREDVDRIRYTISANSRLPGGVFLSYLGTLGEDGGGSIFLQDERHNLQMSWRYRQVSILMNAIQSDVIQGDSRRKDLSVTANILRVF
jgi:hypothetical protein